MFLIVGLFLMVSINIRYFRPFLCFKTEKCIYPPRKIEFSPVLKQSASN